LADTKLFWRWRISLAGNHLTLKRFTKADRLLKRSDFLKLSFSGTKIHNGHFVLIYSKTENKKSRLGITVTKKVGKSVIRNRIKRYCREFFRLNRCIIPENMDINIIAKRNALALDSKQIFQTLEHIFRKIN
jgi:ribonuclease P protein component